MLNGRLELHGVDVEALANDVLNKALRSRNITLDESRREDLLADLIGYTWELSRSFDANRNVDPSNPTQAFKGWAYRLLQFRIIDWFRKTEGRRKWQFREYVYEKPRPTLVPIDAGLVEIVGPRRLDPAERGDEDLRRVLARGDSPEA